LDRLVKERKYEEAFSSVLSAKNINLLTWLCTQIDPSSLFSDDVPLSQYVLLSLIQQLGYDLAKDTELKLNWLREACLVLNLTDTVISQHAPVVLTKLLRNLEGLYPKFSDGSNPSGTSFKLLMHIVNSLLK